MNNEIIKKIITVLILSFLFFSNANSEDRKSELNKLFSQLKNSKDLSSAQIVEKKIYELPKDAERTYPFAGKSTVTSLSFNFLDGAKIILACYNMDKEAKENESFLKSVLNQNDSFRIDVRSSAFTNYLKKNE